MNSILYRFLNIKSEIIFINENINPKKENVKGGDIEKLLKETVFVQYMTIENSFNYKELKNYYIQNYKPKFNKKVDKIDKDIDIKNEKWIDCPKNGDIRKLEWMINTLMDKFFYEDKFDYFVNTTQRRNRIGVISERRLFDKGKAKYEILVCENDLFKNSKRMLIDVLCQIIQIIILQYGVKGSNHGNYINKWVAEYFHKYGIKTVRTKYGYEPINCDEKYINELSPQCKFGKSDIHLYIPGERIQNGKKKTSTRKYICPCCGNSFRATKNINMLCLDCNKVMRLVS